jgi:heme exporter protein A
VTAFASVAPAVHSVAATVEAVASVEARGLERSIDGRRVLCGIDLTVRRGDFVGVLGANGAGKSTLIKLFATLAPPTGGQLLLWGTPIQKVGPALRRRIGLIDHNLMLYRDLSARANLEFFAHLYGLSNARARAIEALRAMGLERRADDAVKSFSRGMAQRVAIARALLHDPDLLLADEPFTGLDAASAAGLEQLFADLRDAGRTIIMVNHDVAQTLRAADRVVVLRRGRVALDRSTRGADATSVLAEVTAA